MDLFEKCHNEFMQRVEGLKKENIYPYFTELTSGQDTEVMMNGKKTPTQTSSVCGGKGGARK